MIKKFTMLKNVKSEWTSRQETRIELSGGSRPLFSYKERNTNIGMSLSEPEILILLMSLRDTREKVYLTGKDEKTIKAIDSLIDRLEKLINNK